MAEVRLFAVLRELAGAPTVEAEGDSVEAIVQDLCDRHGDRFASIVRVSSVVVDGERASLEMALSGHEEIAILPPVSGGGA